MDYGSRWAEAPVPQPHHAVYSAAAHHHVNPPHYHQQQTLPLPSSYLTTYYTNPNPNAGPKLDDPVPADAAAAAAATTGTDLYARNPFAPHGGYEGPHAAAATPGTDPYARNPFAPHGGYEGPHAAAAAAPYSYTGLGPGAAPSSYYYGAGGGGGGGGNTNSLAVKEAIRQYGVDPQSYGAQARSSNGPKPTVPLHQHPAYWENVTHPATKQATRKRLKRTTKVVQSAYCEVCKIDCNSQEVLKTHKQGKKHKKNLLKLQEAITAKPAKAPATTVDKETPAADKGKVVGEQRKKRPIPATEELEMKKLRLLEGGATADEIKVCTICNVVVNKQIVFDCHMAGQKHASMVKKQQAVTPMS